MQSAEETIPRAGANLPLALDDAALAQGLAVLSSRDPDLAGVLAAFGPPPIWARPPGFPTLIHIILEQQVSLASARAAYDRLLAAAAPLTPRRFLEFSDEELKAIGFSRQKTAYGRILSAAILAGELDLDGLRRLDDAAVRAALTRIKGIGRWSADIYLLMVLLRPDVWPKGDLALVQAAREVKRLPSTPSADEMETLGDAWRPWRAVAARLLWHHYLSRPRAKKG